MPTSTDHGRASTGQPHRSDHAAAAGVTGEGWAEKGLAARGGAVGSEELSSGGYPRISSAGHSPAPHPQTQPPERTIQIGRWGNVLAVRLPQALSQLLHLQQGDRLTLQLLSSGQLLLTPCTRRSRIALAQQLQEMQARLQLP